MFTYIRLNNNDNNNKKKKISKMAKCLHKGMPIRHEEGGDPTLVQRRDEPLGLGVEDRLPDERQRRVAHGARLRKAG